MTACECGHVQEYHVNDTDECAAVMFDDETGDSESVGWDSAGTGNEWDCPCDMYVPGAGETL